MCKFTNEILKECIKNNIKSIAVSNNPNGVILKNSNFKIVLNTQQEVVAGSTRLSNSTKNMLKYNIDNSYGKIRKC